MSKKRSIEETRNFYSSKRTCPARELRGEVEDIILSLIPKRLALGVWESVENKLQMFPEDTKFTLYHQITEHELLPAPEQYEFDEPKKQEISEMLIATCPFDIKFSCDINATRFVGDGECYYNVTIDLAIQ